MMRLPRDRLITPGFNVGRALSSRLRLPIGISLLIRGRRTGSVWQRHWPARSRLVSKTPASGMGRERGRSFTLASDERGGRVGLAEAGGIKSMTIVEIGIENDFFPANGNQGVKGMNVDNKD